MGRWWDRMVAAVKRKLAEVRDAIVAVGPEPRPTLATVPARRRHPR